MSEVLVVNVGGVTLDLSVIDAAGTQLATQLVDPWNGRDTTPIREFAAARPTLTAVGHRVVHGGDLDAPTRLDARVIAAIAHAAELSPVHQDRALAGIDAARSVLPHIPHVACFDTTFHRTIPEPAATYALPAAWQHWPVRRRGFHGLSYQHVANATAGIAEIRRPLKRIVSCHLGSGASVCAIDDGRSIDTTMGATPLDGLVMTHRSGSVDPGLLLWLIQRSGMTVGEVADGLTELGGLGGLAGGSGDMRDIVARRNDGDSRATLAFDVYIHRLSGAIATMTASLGGIDALAFTGGIGEHMPVVRAAAVGNLGFLGIDIRHETQDETFGDRDITAADATVTTVVVATGEDLVIAADTLHVIATSS